MTGGKKEFAKPLLMSGDWDPDDMDSIESESETDRGAKI